jgi:hypothetical protein
VPGVCSLEEGDATSRGLPAACFHSSHVQSMKVRVFLCGGAGWREPRPKNMCVQSECIGCRQIPEAERTAVQVCFLFVV